MTDGERRVVERDHLVVAGRVHLAHRVEPRARAQCGSAFMTTSRSRKQGRRAARAGVRNSCRRRRRRRAPALLMITRLGSSWYGIAPGGSATSSSTANAVPMNAATTATTSGLDDHTAEERARSCADRFQHPVEPDALDGEEREEERDDHDGDHERHADDLVEHGSLLAYAADRVGGVRAATPCPSRLRSRGRSRVRPATGRRRCARPAPGTRPGPPMTPAGWRSARRARWSGDAQSEPAPE